MRIIYLLSLVFLFTSCTSGEKENIVITVNGEIPAHEMGMTLTHEHALVDFIGADSTGYHRWDKAEVVSKVLPYLLEIRDLGFSSFIDATPAYLGRDPLLLKMLSDESGLNILTNTGYYGAMNNIALPGHFYEESARQIADRWIAEWTNGIEDTGIKPGFIKIGVRFDSLPPLHEKIIMAAAIASHETGLPIASHTGPAKIAFRELEILEEEGVAPEFFIWVHAQLEQDFEKYREAALMGTWISLDGINERNIQQYADRLEFMRSAELLHKVVISHDAEWYSPGETGGGNFRPYTALSKHLVPLLRENGFTDEDLDLMMKINPASAYRIRDCSH